MLQGKNMLVFRAGNKGAVCLPFRLHQSTLVVAAAHLPADGSRRSKVRTQGLVGLDSGCVCVNHTDGSDL